MPTLNHEHSSFAWLDADETLVENRTDSAVMADSADDDDGLDETVTASCGDELAHKLGLGDEGEAPRPPLPAPLYPTADKPDRSAGRRSGRRRSR